MKYYKDELPQNERVSQNLFVIIKAERIQIKPEDIIYMRADVNYTKFFTINRCFTVSFHLGFFEKSLETYPYFIRISKSHILNLKYLKGLRWKKSSKQARMIDDTLLPISRRRASGIKEILWNKVKNERSLSAASEAEEIVLIY